MSTHTSTPRPWSRLLESLIAGEPMGSDDSRWALERLFSGELSDSQVAGFLVALRMKGETEAELVDLADAMVKHAVDVPLPADVLDILGTGGDGLGTVNISTMSSLVAAGCGVPIIKHGNRGASTTSGAADVIEELGVNLDLPMERVAEGFQHSGMAFLFAQKCHPGMKHVMSARRGLGIPTTFNLLGPLANPVRPRAQALGCASLTHAPVIARAQAQRGVRAVVFRGRDGRDKVTLSDATDLWEVRDSQVSHEVVNPADFGFDLCATDDLRGSSAVENARIVKDLLAGQRGPVRDAVVLNTAVGLVAADPLPQVGPLVQRITAQLPRAVESIDSGAAARVLERWVEISA